jgi:anti-anti-sigma factor
LVLFHHDPDAEDEEIWRVRQETVEYLSQDLTAGPPPEVVVASEGLEVNLSDERDFSVGARVSGDVAIVSLKGRFDAYGADVFEARLDALVRETNLNKVVLNMEDVVELNMAGVKALLEARKYAYGVALAQLPSHIHRWRRSALRTMTVINSV